MGLESLSDEDIVKKLRQAKAKLDRAQESLRLSEHEGTMSKWQQQLASLESRLSEIPDPKESLAHPTPSHSAPPLLGPVDDNPPPPPGARRPPQVQRKPLTPVAQHKGAQQVNPAGSRAPVGIKPMGLAGYAAMLDTQTLQLRPPGDNHSFVDPPAGDQHGSGNGSNLPEVPLSPFLSTPMQPYDTEPGCIRWNQGKKVGKQPDEGLQDVVSKLNHLLSMEAELEPDSVAQSRSIEEPDRMAPVGAVQGCGVAVSSPHVDLIGQKLDQTLGILMQSRQQYSHALEQTQAPNPEQSCDPPAAKPARSAGNAQSLLGQLRESSEELGQLLRQGTEPLVERPQQSFGRAPSAGVDKIQPLESSVGILAKGGDEKDHVDDPMRTEPGLKGPQKLAEPEQQAKSVKRGKNRALSTYSHLLSRDKHSTTLQWEMGLRNSDQPGLTKWRN